MRAGGLRICPLARELERADAATAVDVLRPSDAATGDGEAERGGCRSRQRSDLVGVEVEGRDRPAAVEDDPVAVSTDDGESAFGAADCHLKESFAGGRVVERDSVDSS